MAAKEVHDESGSYSVQVPDTNLRILSVNTQYWYKQNLWLYDRDEQIADPNGLFAFMVDQFQIAEDASQRVWIIGHIPSGKADFAHDQSNYYNQIVQRYNNTIAAQFFGHIHKARTRPYVVDQFEIAYSDWDNRNADTADSIIFIGPALTPSSMSLVNTTLNVLTNSPQAEILHSNFMVLTQIRTSKYLESKLSTKMLVFVTLLLAHTLLVRASLQDGIISAFNNATDCTSCRASVLPALPALAREGDGAFAKTMTSICQTLHTHDDDICAGEMQLSGLIMAHDLRQFTVNGTTATKFCEAVFGVCQQPSVTPYTVPSPRSRPSKPTTFTSKGRTPFQVVHLSDVHIGRQYTVARDGNCTKNICCRKYADQTGPVTEPAGPFGNHGCDSPSTFADSLVQAVNTIGAKASFSIFTGDIVEGATWLVTKGFVQPRLYFAVSSSEWFGSEVSLDLAAWDFQMAQGIHIPVYPAIGTLLSLMLITIKVMTMIYFTETSVDSVPINSFSRNITKTSGNPQWVFDIQSALWE
ncbi:hypothetical protein EWM64_g10411, partial [Hericium alpestre]